MASTKNPRSWAEGPMRIAILGATSMLAADYAAFSMAQPSAVRFSLFARNADQIKAALAYRGVTAEADCRPLDTFDSGEWDAIISFIGVGDPARAIAMGADILQITRYWDDRILDYLRRNTQCRYVFLSSGAALGLAAAQPSAADTTARFAINDLGPSAYYGISKFYAEAVHRASAPLSIIDIRIFNYISRFADLGHRFFINEAIASIKNSVTLHVDANNMWRDYLDISDFHGLMTACLNAPSNYNRPIDAYSRSPASKAEILKMLQEDFGLDYRVSNGGIDATGSKSDYYSKDRTAETLGYQPRFSSIETIRTVARHILGG